MNKYYQTIFEWFNNCEKIFGFNLTGYGKMRIYGLNQLQNFVKKMK